MRGQLHLLRLLHDMLDQVFSGLPEQRLARKTGGTIAGGNHNNCGKRGQIKTSGWEIHGIADGSQKGKELPVMSDDAQPFVKINLNTWEVEPSCHIWKGVLLSGQAKSHFKSGWNNFVYVFGLNFLYRSNHY
jgi:hypothetical protein